MKLHVGYCARWCSIGTSMVSSLSWAKDWNKVKLWLCFIWPFGNNDDRQSQFLIMNIDTDVSKFHSQTVHLLQQKLIPSKKGKETITNIYIFSVLGLAIWSLVIEWITRWSWGSSYVYSANLVVPCGLCIYTKVYWKSCAIWYLHT